MYTFTARENTAVTFISSVTVPEDGSHLRNAYVYWAVLSAGYAMIFDPLTVSVLPSEVTVYPYGTFCRASLPTVPHSFSFTSNVTVYVLTIALKPAVTVTGSLSMWSAGIPDHESKTNVYWAVGSEGVAETFVPLIVSTLPWMNTSVPYGTFCRKAADTSPMDGSFTANRTSFIV